MLSMIIDEFKFNFRVSCVVFSKDKKRILVNSRRTIDFWVFPGGRVNAGEDTVTCLQREFMEELNVLLKDIKLKVVLENFFNFDNKQYHELQYVYTAYLKNKDIEKHTKIFDGVEKDADIYQWVNVADFDKINYLPKCIIPCVKELFEGNYQIRHIISRENN